MFRSAAFQLSRIQMVAVEKEFHRCFIAQGYRKCGSLTICSITTFTPTRRVPASDLDRGGMIDIAPVLFLRCRATVSGGPAFPRSLFVECP